MTTTANGTTRTARMTEAGRQYLAMHLPKRCGGCATPQKAVLQRNNPTGYLGVRHSKRPGFFTAEIGHDRQHHYLGSFPSAIEAAQAYDAAAIRLHGAAARVNFPTEAAGVAAKQNAPTG